MINIFVLICEFNSITGMVDDNLEDDELCEHPMTIINVFDNVAEMDSSAIYKNVLNERANKDLIFNLNEESIL